MVQSKLISEVGLGDKVLSAHRSGTVRHADVVMVSHPFNLDKATFVKLVTNKGRSLKLTPDHFVPAGSCGTALSDLEVIRAAMVTPGMCVQTVTGEEIVSSVDTVEGEGVYAHVTMEEFVVVNGIIASPQASNYVSHEFAHQFSQLHRFLYTYIPYVAKSEWFKSNQRALRQKIGMK